MVWVGAAALANRNWDLEGFKGIHCDEIPPDIAGGKSWAGAPAVMYHIGQGEGSILVFCRSAHCISPERPFQLLNKGSWMFKSSGSVSHTGLWMLALPPLTVWCQRNEEASFWRNGGNSGNGRYILIMGHFGAKASLCRTSPNWAHLEMPEVSTSHS